MVHLAKTWFTSNVKKFKPLRKFLQGKFIDSIRLNVRGGSGGMGLPKYGGIGGKGGDVFFIVKEGETLKTVYDKWPQKQVRAGSGGNSHIHKLMGEPGEDKYVSVPRGVSVIDHHGHLLGELDGPDESLLVAQGGVGGSSNTDFLAGRGQSNMVRLDLKLIADVGLVGFPNAGKSTLLKAISRATPKVASYPFTTVRPELGMVQFRDLRQISVADLPGLLEGAHANRGMGHSFLRHVERTRLLLLVADANGFQLSPHHEPRTCLQTVLLLNKELELYKEELLEKPALLVINKLDLPGANVIFDEVKEKVKDLRGASLDCLPEELRPEHCLQFEEVVGISANNADETSKQLKNLIRNILDDSAA